MLLLAAILRRQLTVSTSEFPESMSMNKFVLIILGHGSAYTLSSCAFRSKEKATAQKEAAKARQTFTRDLILQHVKGQTEPHQILQASTSRPNLIQWKSRGIRQYVITHDDHLCDGQTRRISIVQTALLISQSLQFSITVPVTAIMRMNL